MTDREINIDDEIRSVLKQKLKRYLSGVIAGEIVRHHHKLPKNKIKEDEGPTNAMGTSSSTSGAGNIDTFDPLLFVKLARRKRLAKGMV